MQSDQHLTVQTSPNRRLVLSLHPISSNYLQTTYWNLNPANWDDHHQQSGFFGLRYMVLQISLNAIPQLNSVKIGEFSSENLSSKQNFYNDFGNLVYPFLMTFTKC